MNVDSPAKRPSKPRPARITDDAEFRSRLSSWSNKQHQDQSKAGTILWLQDTFETGCRESIAKEEVYRRYVAHCQVEGSEPLRASMFGKLVHRAFPGLKSSRIGTRGATRHSYKSFRPRLAGSGLPTHLAGSRAAAHETRLPYARPVERAPLMPQVKHQVPDEDGGCSSSERSSNPSSPRSSSFSIPSSEDHHDVHMHQGGQTHQYPFTSQESSVLQAGDSSPTSCPSPPRPFDSFAYTSDAFSPYLTSAGFSSILSTPAQDCTCVECAQQRRLPQLAAHPSYGYSLASYDSTFGLGQSYWASQNSSMMRRPPQPSMPLQVPVVEDFMFRNLGVSL